MLFPAPHKNIMWFLFMIFRGLIMDNSDRILHLQGVLNARELGGLPLKDSRVVKHNKIIRTGRLSNLTAEGYLACYKSGGSAKQSGDCRVS